MPQLLLHEKFRPQPLRSLHPAKHPTLGAMPINEMFRIDSSMFEKDRRAQRFPLTLAVLEVMFGAGLLVVVGVGVAMVLNESVSARFVITVERPGRTRLLSYRRSQSVARKDRNKHRSLFAAV